MKILSPIRWVGTCLAILCLTGCVQNTKVSYRRVDPPPPVGEQLGLVADVDRQPLLANAERVTEALNFIGAPISSEDLKRLNTLSANSDDAAVIAAVQEILDPYCIIGVEISPESRVKLHRGPAPAELIQQGWRAFLVKVHNQAGVTAPLEVESPHALPPFNKKANLVDEEAIADRWAHFKMNDDPPMRPTLSGLEVEYRIVEIFSRDAGKREASIAMNVGQGSQDIGFRNEVSILFTALPATEVMLNIRDPLGRAYPHPSKRFSPKILADI